ncbi:MAG: hypothetical protein RL391_1081 [Actinomycetota bacterium]|jgi:hypothetical protein
MPLHEGAHRFIGTRPRDSIEVDAVTVREKCLLDRGGFSVALTSTGRPEPQHRWPIRLHEVGQFGDECDVSADRSRRFRIGAIRTTGDQ